MPVKKKVVFITGGARSGKSRFALEGALRVSGKKAFIATAEASDDEMRERINRHKQDRGEGWETYEEPLKIVDVLGGMEGRYGVVVIDCLTLWLANVMQSALDVDAEIEQLISSLARPSLPSVFIVSNEVGMGIVPENELARRFRDMAGRLNQRVAGAADEVYVTLSGIPLKIK
jgi:adenosylcobinamide kinase/adenosylcobinamide-phosphate guanylyltransferase